MASFDGFAVLESIGSGAELFRPIATDVAKAARALSLKYLKNKGLTLTAFRAMRKAFGQGDQFVLLIEGMKDTEVKSIVTKLDKNFPELKTATASSLRQHLWALADGEVEPAERKGAVKKAKSKTVVQSNPERLSSRAMTADRKRNP